MDGKSPSLSLSPLLTFALALLLASPAQATFHLAHISKILTSFGGDPDAQYVEIGTEGAFQNLVGGTILVAFDANGSFPMDVFTVPSHLSNDFVTQWSMATQDFVDAIDPGEMYAPDYIMSPGLPTDGMLCWGAPGMDRSVLSSYVDCVAYGDYQGGTNSKAGRPARLDADGHVLATNVSSFSRDSLDDYSCSASFSASNENDASVPLSGSACPLPRTFTPTQSLAFSNDPGGGTLSGTIDPVAIDAATVQAEGVCLGSGGACAPQYDALLFQVTLDPGSADLTMVGALPITGSSIAGFNNDAAHRPDGSALTRAPDSGSSGQHGFTALQAGETSDVLFMTNPYGWYERLGSPTSISTTFSIVGTAGGFTTAPVIVPEPATLPASAVALGILALVRRKACDAKRETHRSGADEAHARTVRFI